MQDCCLFPPEISNTVGARCAPGFLSVYYYYYYYYYLIFLFLFIFLLFFLLKIPLLIYRFKLDNKKKEPSLEVLKTKMKGSYKLELYVARKNGVLSKHYAKWDAFISLLS